MIDLVLMMMVDLVLGRVIAKAKVETRAIGIMADLPCAKRATNPARARTAANDFYISGHGQRVHLDQGCPTIRRSMDVKEWQVCGMCGQ